MKTEGKGKSFITWSGDKGAGMDQGQHEFPNSLAWRFISGKTLEQGFDEDDVAHLLAGCT